MSAMGNEVVSMRHAEHVIAIKHQLARLNAAVNQGLNVDPDRLNWGHVGDAGYIREELDKLIKFLQIK